MVKSRGSYGHSSAGPLNPKQKWYFHSLGFRLFRIPIAVDETVLKTQGCFRRMLMDTDRSKELSVACSPLRDGGTDRESGNEAVVDQSQFQDMCFQGSIHG